MTSNEEEIQWKRRTFRTPLEEILFVVESTNEIVSEHSASINRIREILGDILNILQEKDDEE